MGLSPKEYAELIRFNYLNTLMLRETISASELAYVGDFYDHSHLIKHFQRMPGLTPKVFKENASRRPEALFLLKNNIYELISRSVERRVGKECVGKCRSRWTHNQEKKKNK